MNQPPAIDVPYAHVVRTIRPSFGHRLLAVLSLSALVLITASVSFYMGSHLANHPLDAHSEAQSPLIHERSPAIDLKSTNLFDSSVTIANSPLPATAPISSPSKPASADITDLATQSAAISTTALTAPRISSSPTTRPLPAEEIANLLARGDALLSGGDLTSARLFYERAADAGDAGAALRIGETYDPSFLMRVGVIGVQGDIAEARRWYRRAVDLGAPEAKLLLEGAENK